MPAKFYAVKVGRTPGVYNTWEEAKAQVLKFPNAIHKSFKDYDQARAYCELKPTNHHHKQTLKRKALDEKAIPLATALQTPSKQSPKIQQFQTLLMRFDGGARRNPGPAGCGSIVYDSISNRVLWEGCKYLSYATNNEAEYMGLIEGLRAITSTFDIEHVDIEGDSNLVIQQLKGKFKVKAANLSKLHRQAKELLGLLPSYSLRHIYRNKNAAADGLANEAMDSKTSRKSLKVAKTS